MNTATLNRNSRHYISTWLRWRADTQSLSSQPDYHYQCLENLSYEQDKFMTTEGKQQSRSISPNWLLLPVAAVFCLLTGLGTIFVAKWQNRHYLSPSPYAAPVYYEQPYWQTFIMFIAEALCLFIYYVDTKVTKRGILEFTSALENPASPTPWWWFALPSLADLVGTSLVNFAFAMTYASTVQMLRNSLVLFTAAISIVTLRKPLRVYEWTGIVVMTLGMLLSGIDAILNPEKATNSDPSKSYLGIVLVLIGTVLNAITIISEEWMLKVRYCPPFRAVGYCGVTGLIWNLIALPIVQLAGIQDVKANFYMIRNSTTLLVSQFVYIVTSLVFNGSGMIVTKIGSGLLKGTLYACRAPLMWLIEIALGWQNFSYISLGGLVLTFFGFFVYANLVPRPKSQEPSLYDAEVPCCCIKPHHPSETLLAQRLF